MATNKTKVTVTRKDSSKNIKSEIRPSRSIEAKNSSLLDKLQLESDRSQSILNLVLGALIVIVLGVIIFNFFNKPKTDGLVGPSDQAATDQTNAAKVADVNKDSLPGKYTIKDGDTLFSIAQSYYNDGYQYPSIVQANKIQNENTIEVGQVIDIPKMDQANNAATPTLDASTNTGAGVNINLGDNQTQPVQGATGGATNQTIWGERITADSYTVLEGDWLSKISGRAYGDIMMFDKIAKANNIADPNNIEPGTVLKLPK